METLRGKKGHNGPGICVSPCRSMARDLRRIQEKVGDVDEASPLPGIYRFLL